jgi:hypothetical protein
VNRTIGGIPLTYWAGALIAGIVGFMYFRKRSTSPTGGGGAQQPGQPSFTQQQEVQDFQIFSALTSQQQASDVSFLGQVASLFSGGSSTGTPPTGTTPSSPPVTPSAPPATTPAPAAPGAAPKTPGYGTINTAQGQMVWLGVNQAGQPIYNVGGGAPVYFGNSSALATGAQYEKPGYDIYTPLSDASMVSQQTSTLGQPYVGG